MANSFRLFIPVVDSSRVWRKCPNLNADASAPTPWGDTPGGRLPVPPQTPARRDSSSPLIRGYIRGVRTPDFDPIETLESHVFPYKSTLGPKKLNSTWSIYIEKFWRNLCSSILSYRDFPRIFLYKSTT